MNTERYNVTAGKLPLLDLGLSDEHAVGAIEVLDHAALGIADELQVMAAYELALDVDLVIRGAADDNPSGRKRM